MYKTRTNSVCFGSLRSLQRKIQGTQEKRGTTDAATQHWIEGESILYSAFYQKILYFGGSRTENLFSSETQYYNRSIVVATKNVSSSQSGNMNIRWSRLLYDKIHTRKYTQTSLYRVFKNNHNGSDFSILKSAAK